MTITISIIGLDQVGASFGLALGESDKDFHRIGYDRDVKAGPQAVKDKIIDKSSFNLSAAVDKADYIVISVPAFELKTALQVIGPVIKEGAVVVDTSLLKTHAADWASEYLPAGRWYVSVSPTRNPDFFTKSEPDAGLFRNSLMVITAGKGTPEEVVENVVGLAQCVGAQIQFSDPLEHDGLQAAVQQLPELAAAALMHSVSCQPGWVESRKQAGGNFAGASAPLQPLAGLDSPADDLFQNRENTLRMLDSMIASLKELRELIAGDNQKEVNDFFASACAERQAWLEQRRSAQWERRIETPDAPGIVSRLFGMGSKARKK
jgi:prephenate dehydrogenase